MEVALLETPAKRAVTAEACGLIDEQQPAKLREETREFIEALVPVAPLTWHSASRLNQTQLHATATDRRGRYWRVEVHVKRAYPHVITRARLRREPRQGIERDQADVLP
jgi:hypothetical protein